MALTATAVRVGVTGRIYYAPQGTTPPTTTSASLGTGGWYDVGYASDDGVSLTTDTATTDIRGWQNGDLLRRVQTSVTFALNFTMVETNEGTLKLFFNNYTHGAGAADGIVTMNGALPYRGAFVCDVIDGTALLRFVMPDGQVSDRDDVNITSADAIGWGVTISGYPDVSGNSGYLYIAADAAS